MRGEGPGSMKMGGRRRFLGRDGGLLGAPEEAREGVAPGKALGIKCWPAGRLYLASTQEAHASIGSCSFP